MSTRRIKDRGGGNSAAATKVDTLRPTRSVTPLSSSRKPTSLDASAASKLYSSAEKENSQNRRSMSRGSASNPSQKPAIRPVPRVDKASIAAGDSRSRRSATSVPRGRSTSPSGITRASSDSLKTRRVSVDRVIKDPAREPRGYSNSGEKVKPSAASSKAAILSDAELVRVPSVRLKDPILKDGRNRVSEEESGGGGGGSSSTKYPSRLHEKLAFLEGKVKRIASDIKKTKEMLDMNNPDASKVILSDIQDKISGIEKAMIQVTNADSGSNCNGDKESDMVDGSKRLGEEGKNLIKGLNNEELEARLFPHHKLIRNRTLMTKESTSGSCLGNEIESNLVNDNKVLKPVDENSITMEFLVSLDNKDTQGGGGGGGDIGCGEVQETEGDPSAAGNGMKGSSCGLNQKCDIDMLLTADEKLEDFDDQENKTGEFVGDEMDEAFNYELNEIGNRSAAAGWFVSEGEAVLLAHDDGSCSYYDIANCEEKALYMPPPEVSPNMWRDCWVIRAPGSDGCSGRFVVAASAGNTVDSGFCSWDFYTKEVRAFEVEIGTTTTSSRTALRPLANNIVQRRSSASGSLVAEAGQWWYKPCGPLIISAASTRRDVKVFDVRDGEQIMKWEVQRPVLAVEYCSPLQWRNRGKVVIAEAESISLWDVNSLSPQALLSVPTGGRKISALHVSNTDAELGGGVRKRASSSEAEGNDGVFCTADSINILDFRQPSGVGLRISKQGANVQSVFSRGDSVFLGCTSSSSVGKKQSSSLLQQFSLRKQGLLNTYTLPESNAHPHHAAITQVWGNSDIVMGVCGRGLYLFDAQKDDALQTLNTDNHESPLMTCIGPDDMYWPSFDYHGSRALLISRDRPAMWRHLIV